MSIADTVAGVGCVCRNSVQHIGTDVLFLDQSGLRSFGRTIQEKSMPINDLSLNIKTEFIEAIAQRTGPTSSVFSPENSFYLISFPNQQITYCFDLKGTLENGAYRVTRWTTNLFKSYERKPDGTLYIGSAQGVGEYVDYSDNGESYRFRYYSPGLTFGDPYASAIGKTFGQPNKQLILNAMIVQNYEWYKARDSFELFVVLSFKSSRLTMIQNGQDMADAFANGSLNGGVGAFIHTGQASEVFGQMKSPKI